MKFLWRVKILDKETIGKFVSIKRKKLRMTQKQLAKKLGVSFQSVSKWENGLAYPGIDILPALARELKTTTDEILDGCECIQHEMTYKKAGVDILHMNSIKNEMINIMNLVNRYDNTSLDSYASLCDAHFPWIEHPMLLLKTEDPGSKQKLAMEYGYVETICYDLINHLINDIVVMGGTPLVVLDTIVCGDAQKERLKKIVESISNACNKNECFLIGGKTSVQPQVLGKGTYFLSASAVGIVEKNRVFDGTKIKEGDVILGIESNGLHTSGYSLVRLLIDKIPEITMGRIEGKTFIEQIMQPHTSYYQAVKGLQKEEYLHGMAHITGGGIVGNLRRVLHDGMCAEIDLSRIHILPIFKYIKEQGKICDTEMLQIFNLGVGFVLIVSPDRICDAIKAIPHEFVTYEIGRIILGGEKISLINELKWESEKFD